MDNRGRKIDAKSPLAFKFVNLGCAKNLVDSERMAGILEDASYRIIDDESSADCLVINTCSFIEDARKEAVETILRGIDWKNSKSDRKLFVMGCLPQRYPGELTDELPEVDGFFGVGDFSELLNAVNNTAGEIQIPLKTHNFTAKHYRYLGIADGCSNGCSFCAIPLIRGNYKSRPIDEILKEAEYMVSQGAKEIILTAQETTGYGSDLPGNINLAKLLHKMALEIPAQWIRLLYMHPPKVTEELIEIIAGSEKICSYFDFPIEHISDTVLKRMNRRITRREIEDKLNNIKKNSPEGAIRTSLITGFPGESEAEFRELVEFVEEGWFDRMGVFTYSHEEGTAAFRLKSDVPTDEASYRQDILMEAQREISAHKNRLKIGTEMDVLADEIGDDGVLFGRTVYHAPDVDGGVEILGKAEPGEMIKVKIIDSGDYDLTGKII